MNIPRQIFLEKPFQRNTSREKFETNIQRQTRKFLDKNFQTRSSEKFLDEKLLDLNFNKKIFKLKDF